MPFVPEIYVTESRVYHKTLNAVFLWQLDFSYLLTYEIRTILRRPTTSVTFSFFHTEYTLNTTQQRMEYMVTWT